MATSLTLKDAFLQSLKIATNAPDKEHKSVTKKIQKIAARLGSEKQFIDFLGHKHIRIEAIKVGPMTGTRRTMVTDAELAQFVPEFRAQFRRLTVRDFHHIPLGLVNEQSDMKKLVAASIKFVED